MKQWYALHTSLYSYEFMIWPDCFVGHSCPGGICPKSSPLSLTCSIITMLDILLMLLSSSNRKYQPYPLLSYFSVVVCLRCLSHHILSPIAYTFRENRDFVFIIIAEFMMSTNSWIRFCLQMVFVSLYNTSSHYHHYANLSEDIGLKKMPVRYILSGV